ncbi:unnamed protein product [Aphanomyces euteiches]
MQTNIDATVRRIVLQDLTEAGCLHRDVAVPFQCTCTTNNCSTLSFAMHDGAPRLTVHGVQMTWLWRFYIELWNYVYLPTGGIDIVSAAFVQTFSPHQSNVAENRSPLLVVFDQVALCFPRNSSSIDMIAFVMNECIFTKSFVHETWDYSVAMERQSAYVPDSSGNLPCDGPRQKNNLLMKQCSIYCADTQSVVNRQWTFRKGTHSSSPKHKAQRPSNFSDASTNPVPRILDGTPYYMDSEISWKKLTMSPVDVVFVRDFPYTNSLYTRDLFIIKPALKLEMEVTAYTVLLSLWYDNLAEYTQFPAPFVPPTNFCESYLQGPHPHWDPFQSLNQLPPTHLDFVWEVGYIVQAIDLQMVLNDQNERLSLTLVPLVCKVYGSYNTTFMRCGVVAQQGHLMKLTPSSCTVLAAATSTAPFCHNMDIYQPFDTKTSPQYAVQFSMVRFAYGYVMMGVTLDKMQVGLLGDPNILAFVVEYFSTYFYDPAYGYPWPLPDAFIPHVHANQDEESEELLLEPIFSQLIRIHNPQVPIHVDGKTLHIQGKGLPWTILYEWTTLDCSTKVSIPGVEGHMLAPNSPLRTAFTPVSIDWDYSIHMPLWQQTSKVCVTRFDSIFPDASDLTVFIYLVPHDMDFFEALSTRYMESLFDDEDDNSDEEEEDDETQTKPEAWTSLAVYLPERLGVMLLDNIVVFQKPLLQCIFSNLEIHMLQTIDQLEPLDPEVLNSGSFTKSLSHQAMDIPPEHDIEVSTPTVFVKVLAGFQVDAFNNIVRAWEPFVEFVRLKVLAEQCPTRGRGLVVSITDSCQINITEHIVSVLLEYLHNESTDQYSRIGLINYSGKPVRYFQPQPRDQGSRQEVTYVGNNSVGQLVCPPIMSVVVDRHKLETTVLNQNDLQVLFSSQDHSYIHTLCTTTSGASSELTYDVSIQLFGFRWLHNVDLNQSGYFYYDLVPECPRITCADKCRDMYSFSESLDQFLATAPPGVRAALRCLVHVHKTRWGQNVELQSLFQVQNNTSFELVIALGATKSWRDVQDKPIHLAPGQVYHVPLQPLYKYAALSMGKHIGILFLAPNLGPFEGGGDGINLLDVVCH